MLWPAMGIWTARMKTMMAVATIAAAGLLVVLPVSAQAQVKTLKATVFKGIRYVALKDLATMYGLTLKAGSAPKSWVIAGEYVRQIGRAHV